MEGFDDQPGHIWYNGALVPWKEATTHVLTHAMHYASCVFEGERAYNGRIFKLVEHTERLFNGADVMGMDVPYTPAGGLQTFDSHDQALFQLRIGIPPLY